MSSDKCRRSELISSISNLSGRPDKKVLSKGREHIRGQTEPSTRLAKVRIKREKSGLYRKLTIREDRHLNVLWIVFERDGNSSSIIRRKSLW